MEDVRGGSQAPSSQDGAGVVTGELSTDLVQDQLGGIYSTQCDTRLSVLATATQLQVCVVSTTAEFLLNQIPIEFSLGQQQVLTRELSDVRHMTELGPPS